MDIKSLSDADLQTLNAETADELARRRRVAAIPQEISDLAQQGREIGVADSIMMEAVTRAPEEAPAGEEL